jgi:hypothetical protein
MMDVNRDNDIPALPLCLAALALAHNWVGSEMTAGVDGYKRHGGTRSSHNNGTFDMKSAGGAQQVGGPDAPCVLEQDVLGGGESLEYKCSIHKDRFEQFHLRI